MVHDEQPTAQPVENNHETPEIFELETTESAESAEVTESQPTPDVELSSADDAVEPAPSEAPAPEQDAPEESATEESAPAVAPGDEVLTEEAAPEPQAEPKPEPEPEHPAFVLPTPDLPMQVLFHAPDFSTLPPLPPLIRHVDRHVDQDQDQDDDEGGNGRRRRRGRSRRGATSEAPVVTEPQKVKGSTRLEAKKQRRRDGREAGRRRTVVTESEFLARRESVDRVMVVRSKHDRIQIAVLEDGIVVEHYVAKSSESSLIGNIYLGKVQNVLPSMEAAFVDIGRGRNAVLYSGEVDWDAADLADGQPRRIEHALKGGDTVLVQVSKDPIGHKGARLTSQISLPGRYLVYVPSAGMNGISRKLPDTERSRLKKILKSVLPENAGVIVRTAAEGATEEQLTRDVQRLANQWAEVDRLSQKSNAPQRLHAEPDLLVKIIRDVFNEDFARLVIHGDEALDTIRGYLQVIAPDLLDRVEAYEGDDDPFDRFRVKEQIDKALERKVYLPSGGSLVIDRTEAMTVIDVNTGKFVGSGGNLEETVTKNNLEAAEEIVRQLRLRDLGGIVVIDFIDMVLESNRDLVLRRLVECLSRDRTKHQVAEITSLGLVQMTRKRLGLGLLESYSEACEVCAGRGLIVHHEPIHRSKPPQEEGRRRRSQGDQRAQKSSGQQSGPTNGGTHGITDDARKGLSQIAASSRQVDADGDPVAVTPPSAPEPPARAQHQDEVRILDLPLPPSNAPAEPVQNPDEVLGSVLDAMAPKKERPRRRRASSGIITAKPED